MTFLHQTLKLVTYIATSINSISDKPQPGPLFVLNAIANSTSQM